MNFIDKMVEQFMKVNRRMKRWQRAVSVLSAIVVFVTTYTLVLPAITLDKETATTQPGIEVAASENEAGGDGTVYEAEPEEEPEEPAVDKDEPAEEVRESDGGSAEGAAEDASQDPAENPSASGDGQEDSGSESGSQEAAPAGSASNGEQSFGSDENADDHNGSLTAEEAADYATTEEAIAAVTGQTAAEIKLITEPTQLTFVDEEEAYTVYADFGEEAKLPEGVALQVKEITAESDPEAYQMYYEKALSGVQDKYDENTALTFAKFYDIAFVYEGVEIEPSGYVNVRIEYKEAVEIKEDTTVDTIHFDKNNDEKAEVIDSDTKGTEETVEAVEFESDQFSVYGVVGAEVLTTRFLSANGNTYKVTVEYGPEAEIPAGARVVVSEFEKDSEEYKEAKEAVLGDTEEGVSAAEGSEEAEAAVQGSAEQAASSTDPMTEGEESAQTDAQAETDKLDVIDISLRDAEDNEIEPSAEVSVQIEMIKIPEDTNAAEVGSALTVHHLKETDSGIQMETVLGSGQAQVTEDDTVMAEFPLTSFSRFVLNWNTNNTNRARITIHYVDENGTELSNQHQDVTVTNSNNTIDLHSGSYAVNIPGYTFKEARYGTYLGDTIRYIQTNRDGSTNYVYFRSAEEYDYTGWRTPNPNNVQMHSAGGSNNGRAYTSIDHYQSGNAITTRDVYLVYKGGSTTPTPGGGDDPVIPQDNLDAPYINKTLKENTAGSNWDGTYKLSLDVTGSSETDTDKTTADVIIIVDASGSMSRYSDPTVGKTRWQVATTAVDNLVNSLVENNRGYSSTDPNIPVRVTVIEFSNEARYVARNITSSTALNYVNQQSGTNWEAALDLANRTQTRSTANKYVLFISDGNPTHRETQGNQGGNSYNINSNDTGNGHYGTGSDIVEPAHYIIRCYTQARQTARELVENGFKFYSVAVYAENVYRMENLLNYAYTGFDKDSETPTGQYINAANSAAITNAFAGIINTITKNFDFSDVTISDPITTATSTSLSINGHADDFVYTVYKAQYDSSGNLVKDADGNTIKEPNVQDVSVTVNSDKTVSLKFPDDDTVYTVGGAKFNEASGTVTWDLGDDYALKGGYTYRVSFTVWPNQDTYDDIVELNGLNPDDPADAQKINTILNRNKDIVYDQATGKYYVNSNGDATLSYSKRSVIDGVETETKQPDLHYPNPKMRTLEYSMKIAKVWNDGLYGGNRFKTVTFQIYEDGTAYGEPITLSAEDVAPGSTNRWEKTVPIVPGIISEQINGTTPINSGHNYTVDEISYMDEKGVSHNFDEDYHYEFEPEIIRPMLINGEMKYQEYKDGQYQEETDQDEALTGTNHVRSGVNIMKSVVNGSNVKIDDQTTFYVRLTARDADGNDLVIRDAGGNPVATKDAMQEQKNAFAIWYSEFAKWDTDSDGTIYGMDSSGNRDRWDLSDVWQSGEVKEIKAGQLLQIINIPSGTYIELHEVEKVEGDGGAVSYRDVALNGNVGGYKLIGIDGDATIDSVTPNRQYNTTFTNQVITIPIRIRKADIKSMGETDESKVVTLTGAVFELSKDRVKLYFDTSNNVLTQAEVEAMIPGFADLSEEAQEAALKEKSLSSQFVVDDEITLNKITSGVYTLKEITPPAGYVIKTATVSFTVGDEISSDAEDILIEQASATDAARITVYNEEGAALPKTGGPGTFLYTLGGLMLILASAMMYGFRMRRRERRID